jgi:hypothetical protein
MDYRPAGSYASPKQVIPYFVPGFRVKIISGQRISTNGFEKMIKTFKA